MKVFKFGGASVKDATGIKNVSEIIEKYADNDTLIVVSATGKTTNALESVVASFFDEDGKALEKLDHIRELHFNICKGLLGESNHSVYSQLNDIIADVKKKLETYRLDSYNYVYDQTVSAGELLSSVILSAYLNEKGIKNSWLDVRDVLRTDETYREGVVDWKETTERSNKILKPLLKESKVVTQGFIGSTPHYSTTTLGREGSDYTAAIFANILDAENQTIWKDVPGVMNGDPRKFQDAVFIDELTYLEAVEMTYYGASVIHPKTIKPIQNKKIPLWVKSFINPEGKGTKVYEASTALKYPPIRVLKENQTLLTFHTKDFSFVPDDTVGELLKAFAKANLKINIIQTGAISLQAVVTNVPEKIAHVIELVEGHFNIKQDDDLTILTIRHYNDEIIAKHLIGKEVIIGQKRASTYQALFKLKKD
ncbi:MAG: aspartate kinase [Chitinophagales bacterium]|nr:aspartate kinase [Chitinophagales bacterium]